MGRLYWAAMTTSQVQLLRCTGVCELARGPASAANCTVATLARWPVFIKNVTETEDWGWPHLGIGCGAAEGCFNVTDPATGRGTKFWVRVESWLSRRAACMLL